ncbi:MAG: DUF2523 domain-containing protein [Magnetococcus sp. WYHC-3]
MALPILPILFAAGTKAFLAKVLAWLAAGFVVRMLLGAGFSFAAFYWLSGWLDAYFEKITGSLPVGLGPAMDILALGGFGVAINMILSAMVAGAAIWLAVNSMRIVLSASGVAGAAARQKQFWS